MHIAVIRHSIRNRGGDRLVLEYLSFLAEKEEYHITYWTNEVKSDFSINPKIRLHKIPIPGIWGTILFTLFTKFQADVVIVDLVVMAYFASFRNGNILYLAQDYDITYHKQKILKNFIDWCYHRVLHQLKIPTISVSEGLTERLAIYNPYRLTTVSNGVNLKFFYHDAYSKYQKERTKQFVILFFARKDYRKGLDIAQKTFQLLRQCRPPNDWEIWTIGTEQLNIEWVSIKNWGFIPSDREIREILSACDIYLIASRSEGLSLLLLQALACECMIVTTAASDIITNEENGLVSAIEDAQGLAQNLNRLMDDPSLQKKLQKNARLLAEQYSLERSCELFGDALITLTQKFNEQSNTK